MITEFITIWDSHKGDIEKKIKETRRIIEVDTSDVEVFEKVGFNVFT